MSQKFWAHIGYKQRFARGSHCGVRAIHSQPARGMAEAQPLPQIHHHKRTRRIRVAFRYSLQSRLRRRFDCGVRRQRIPSRGVSTIMTYYAIVHQPACSNIVRVDGEQGGPSERVYQADRLRVAGYAARLRDEGYDVRYEVICPPGDCLTLKWSERKPPLTWSRDCREWA